MKELRTGVGGEVISAQGLTRLIHGYLWTPPPCPLLDQAGVAVMRCGKGTHRPTCFLGLGSERVVSRVGLWL